jgi:hypothetical protein
MEVAAIHNHIVFQFLDRVNSQGIFDETKTMGGIVLPSDKHESAKSPRWAKIISLGPKCSDILRVDGCEILIDALRWSPGVKYQDQPLWRTDEDQLLGYRYPGD